MTDPTLPTAPVWPTWQVLFESDGYLYSANIQAMDRGHAALMVWDLRETARLGNEIVKEIPA